MVVLRALMLVELLVLAVLMVLVGGNHWRQSWL